MNVRRSGCWAKVLGLCSMLGGAKGGGNDVTGGGTCSQQRRSRQDSQPKRARPSRRLFWRRRARGRELLCHAQLTLAASSTQHWLIRFVTDILALNFSMANRRSEVDGSLASQHGQPLLSHIHVAKLLFHPARLYALALPVSPIQPRFAIIPNALRRTKRRRAAGG